MLRHQLRVEGLSDWGALLRELPWLAEVHPVDFARVLLEILGPERGLQRNSGAISARRQRQLEVAVHQLDRMFWPPSFHDDQAAGAGHAAIACIIVGDWREWMPIDRRAGQLESEAPYSLGGIAVCLRRWARLWRRHQRLRTDPAFAQRSLAIQALERRRGRLA